MGSWHLISCFSIFLICCRLSLIDAQQPYIRKATTFCVSRNNSTSILGYTYNGVSPSCQAYLTLRSQPPYNSISSISDLLASNPLQLSQLNSVPENATFETNTMVLVPVNCYRSGQYYQTNTSYVVKHEDTYFFIANNTFQGLTTCQALQVQNSNLIGGLFTGTRINVPLRCACPTKNQSDSGVKYLLTYLVTRGQSVSVISFKFGVDTGRTLAANGLSFEDSTIYPFTTLLVPTENPPSNSQITEPPPSPTPPSPAQPVSPNSGSGSRKTWVYVVVGVVGGLVLLLEIGGFVFCRVFQKRKKKADQDFVSESFEASEKPVGKKLEEESEEFLTSLSSIAQSLIVYKFKELQSATGNFSPSARIKGSVYRGKINGDLAAIKKMNGDVSHEINLLNKINHFNLIRLSGVCFNDGDWYLVYEYAVNGSLNEWIYHSKSDQNPRFLNWTQRIQIALDVATGINYLHQCTSPPYVHKDVKSSNVVLDSDFRAKIANFGLARSADGKEGELAFTRHIVGTKGYMAPEYLENGLISPKLDVYSFGVLMLEIFTGKEVAALYEGLNKHLSEVLIPLLHEEDGRENLSYFMDPSLGDVYPAELALFVVKLINSCVRESTSSRPSMDEVLQSLSRTMSASLSWDLSNK